MVDTHDEPQDTTAGSIGGRIDLLCDRFEAAWKSGQRPDIEEYLDGIAQRHRSKLLRELILLDVYYRDRAGEQPSKEEYEAKYSDTEGVVTNIFHGADTVAFGESEQAPASLEPATQLGDYELLEELGRGGMGVVFRARHKRADRIVALKVIRDDQLGAMSDDRRKQIVERFVTEARAAARLEHDHLVTIYDVGEVEGRHYYSMRFIEGQDLSQTVNAGPLEGDRAARYIEQVARAIHEAHQHEILHRDVKPANILIDEKLDRAWIADFGLARLRTHDSAATHQGDLLGSPCYMSPEQVEDASSVDRTADVYSLGATLYHLLTGRPPFLAASVVNTLNQVRTVEPAAPRYLNPAISADLQTICLKCLSKSPKQRYATAELLADDLRRYLNDEPILAKPPTPLQLFWRWYKKHASLMLGAYYIVSPLTWVFYIFAGLFDREASAGLSLQNPVFLAWPLVWMLLGYWIIKYGGWFEAVNVAAMAAFASLPVFFEKDPQGTMIVWLISIVGVTLQLGSLVTRLRAQRDSSRDGRGKKQRAGNK